MRNDENNFYENFYTDENEKSMPLRTKRSKIRINYKGEQRTLSEVSKLTGIPYVTLHHRYDVGMTDEQIVKNVNYRRSKNVKSSRFEVGDEMLTVSQIAERAGVADTTIYARLNSGIRGLDLLAPANRGNYERLNRLKKENVEEKNED